MRRLALVALAALTGCTATLDVAAGADAGDDPPPTPDAPAATAPGVGAVARGKAWVEQQVPYCQAPNHEHDNDADCSSTCTRPDNPDWDPYRSDCSGFVSWAWDLPAPGRTTHDFAPFVTDITHEIDVTDLRPGDAINNTTHMMLFEDWVTPGVEAHFMEEPGCSSSQPYAREIDAMITSSDGSSITIQYRGTFTAIRYDSAP